MIFKINARHTLKYVIEQSLAQTIYKRCFYSIAFLLTFITHQSVFATDLDQLIDKISKSQSQQIKKPQQQTTDTGNKTTHQQKNKKTKKQRTKPTRILIDAERTHFIDKKCATKKDTKHHSFNLKKLFKQPAKLDVTYLEDFFQKTHFTARHYPTNFINDTEKNKTAKRALVLLNWIKPFADLDDASFDVLLRTGKLTLIARNLGLGENYITQSFHYLDRAREACPTHTEVLYITGMLMSESGAFKKGLEYLQRVEKKGFHEAKQSIAQVYLLTEKPKLALKKLKEFKALEPNNPVIDKQIKKVIKGDFYIWSDILY